MVRIRNNNNECSASVFTVYVSAYSRWICMSAICVYKSVYDTNILVEKKRKTKYIKNKIKQQFWHTRLSAMQHLFYSFGANCNSFSERQRDWKDTKRKEKLTNFEEKEEGKWGKTV